MYINVNNPNKNAIEAAKTNIIEMKHIFESGECLGGKCDVEQQLEKLTNLYNAYIDYFTVADLYGTGLQNRNTNYQLIEKILAINPLNPCNSIDSNTKGFKKIRCLTKNIEILIEAQRIYVDKINIGFLLNKSYADYNADNTNDKKRDYYIKILTEYYELLYKLYARLEKTENLKLIVLKDNSIINAHKKSCESIIEKISKQIDNKSKSKKLNPLSIINSLLITLTEEFSSIDDALPDPDKIEEYKKVEKAGNLILTNNVINRIYDIEQKNDAIISQYEAEKMRFSQSINEPNIDLSLLQTQYEEFINSKKQEKQNLIRKLQEILNGN